MGERKKKDKGKQKKYNDAKAKLCVFDVSDSPHIQIYPK